MCLCVCVDGYSCYEVQVLAEVVNGTINYSRSFSTPVRYSYGTIATYHCKREHITTSVDRVRTCTGDGSTLSGQWNGTAPQSQCQRMFCSCTCIHFTGQYTHTAVDCTTPPSITNGSPGIPTTTTFTGTVTYSCNDGYALFGIATSTCQANAFWSRPPECRGTCAHSVLGT